MRSIRPGSREGSPSSRGAPGHGLAGLLAAIRDAEAKAELHDGATEDRELHAARAQQADELAEAGRRAARAAIEAAFPGVTWPMIAEASL
jgi:hypothetical protein